MTLDQLRNFYFILRGVIGELPFDENTIELRKQLWVGLQSGLIPNIIISSTKKEIKMKPSFLLTI